MTQSTQPMLGHNNPPDIIEIMAQEQKELYSDKLKEIERLLAKEAELPKEVNNDDEAGRTGDYFKLVKTVLGEAEKIRLAEKKKITVRSDAIHNFWKKTLEPLEAALNRADALRKPYIERKEDEKRRAAEEKARLEREEAEAKQKAAEEAARVAREKQEAAEREAAEERRKAEEARIKAEEEAAAAKRKAEEEAAEIRRVAEEEKRLAAEKAAAAQAEIDRLKKEKEDRDKQAQLDEEERKRIDAQHKLDLENARKERDDAESARIQANKDAREQERLAKEREAEADKLAKEKEREARDAARASDEKIRELSKDVKEADREANRSLDIAARADRTASKAEKATFAGSAEFSRTRGFGSVQSISEKWVGEVANRDELDLEAIRDHIPFDALNRAVQSWVNANETNRSLKGAHIFQDSKVITR